MGDRDKDMEILALRHQIAVLERQLGQQWVHFTAPRAGIPPQSRPKRLGRPRTDGLATGAVDHREFLPAFLYSVGDGVRPPCSLQRGAMAAIGAASAAQTQGTTADRPLHPHPGPTRGK